MRGGKLTIVTDQRSVFDGATQELQTPSLRKCFRLASESSGGKVQHRPVVRVRAWGLRSLTMAFSLHLRIPNLDTLT